MIKWFVTTLFLFAFVTLWLSGCISNNGVQENTEISIASQNVERAETTKALDENQQTWQEAYTAFLRNFSEHSDNLNNNIATESSQSDISPISEFDCYTEMETWLEVYAAHIRNSVYEENFTSYFSLRDLDNDGVPELIIHQVSELYALLTIYSYDGNVHKIGDYSDPKAGVAGLRISNNTLYSGLFTMWWGGGVEHYGYLTVEEKKLLYKYLWYDNHNAESPHLKEISDDKQLISESIEAFALDYDSNYHEIHLLNEDNIVEISLQSPLCSFHIFRLKGGKYGGTQLRKECSSL
ncbi:MAG: hypothetical protein FWG90_05050 [Oscillospiraceae bacterium]|nr:hypothetical protein [Oscillospiraceae bacterium]